MKLLIKNARIEVGYHVEDDIITKTNTQLMDVLIHDGKIVQTQQGIQSDFDTLIDAKGQLLIPSFKEMHTHLDKTYFGGEWIAPMPATEGILTRMKEETYLLPEQLTVAKDRARSMIEHYIRNGHTHIRAHANVDPIIGSKHVEITKSVLQEYDDQITYEIVAFPQHGLLINKEEFLSTLEDALSMGITHIGGIDPAMIDRNIGEVLVKTLDLAQKYNIGIDIHLHDKDTLGAFELHRLVDLIENRSFTNSVTISHAFCLAGIHGKELDVLVERLSKNNISIASTIAMGPGEITIPLSYLNEHGVKVYIGHDSLIDHWSPLGSGSSIQKLNYVAQRFGYIDEYHLSQLLHCSTGGISTLDQHGKQVWPNIGDEANLLLVDAVSVAHMIARKCPITTVISKGFIVHKEEIELKGAYRG